MIYCISACGLLRIDMSTKLIFLLELGYYDNVQCIIMHTDTTPIFVTASQSSGSVMPIKDFLAELTKGYSIREILIGVGLHEKCK